MLLDVWFQTVDGSGGESGSAVHQLQSNADESPASLTTTIKSFSGFFEVDLLAYDLLRGFICYDLGSIPIPRQEFCHTIDFVIGDAGQDITEIGFRVEAVEFCGLDE